MTSDRLREAADWIDQNPRLYSEAETAAAALLRAHADLPGWPKGYPRSIRVAVDALADAVLGPEEGK